MIDQKLIDVSNNENGADDFTRVSEEKATKKRKSFGRIQDAAKKLRAITFESGPACGCKRYHCFEVISASEIRTLIKDFNDLGERGGTNLQNNHLSGLITLQPVQRRRPRKPEEEAALNDRSYSYRIRVLRETGTEEIPVCIQAFLYFYGIKPRRLNTIKQSLKLTGRAPVDGRGKHSNRPHKLSAEKRDLMMEFFGSLKGRKAHYSLKDSKRVYLPEHLNIKNYWSYS